MVYHAGRLKAGKHKFIYKLFQRHAVLQTN